MRKQRILQFLFLLLIIFGCNIVINHEKEEYFRDELGGVITDKYISNIHTEYRITTNRMKDIRLDRWCYFNNLWDVIQVGDSIYKPSGTLDLVLISKNGGKSLYHYYIKPNEWPKQP